jgi:SAM-dependent methyltransferase
VTANAPDLWAIGKAYERYIGRWSRHIAYEFLDWLGAPIGLDWLDVGCGTGALSAAVAERCAPRSLIGIDTSQGFLELARQDVLIAAFQQADAQSLPFPAASFDRVVSGLALNFMPDPAQAAGEMARVLRPGGEVALYVWDYGQGMQMIRRFWDAAAVLDPRAAEADEGWRFPLCRPEILNQLLEDLGTVRQIETRALEVPTIFRDFEDYWQPFLGGQGPAPGYCVALSDNVRVQLRQSLQASLPAQADGSIHLLARAFAVRGWKAG